MRSNRILLYFLVFIFQLENSIVLAQESNSEMIRVLQTTQRHPTIYNIYLYGAGSYKAHSNLWIATSPESSPKRVYDTFADLGIEAEAHKGAWFWLGTSLGYKYECYAYEEGFSPNDGVLSHWLTTSVSTNFNIMGLNYGLGAVSDLFLGSRVKSPDHFSFEGLNSECFNRTSLGLYFCANIRISEIKVEGRIGYYFFPQLNPNKIAYYNQHNTHVDGLYWELKASYRIFTSGAHYNSNDWFE